MTRLRIYSAGTGRLQFDSSGSAADVTEESVKRDFKSDLLLYYDPSRNGLRCYVKLVRSGPEQFMADYEFDPGTAEPLASFKSTLEREVSEVDWRVEQDAGHEQRVYESIGTVREASPDVSTDDLQYLLRTEGQLRIGTPDEARAVGVVSYLRRAFDDTLDIAVTYSGETGTHSGVDVVVIPGATDDVTVTREQRAALARWRLGDLRDAVSGGSVAGAASAMRRALVDAGAEDRLGLAIEARDASVPGAAAGQRNAILTTLVLVPLAVLFVLARTGREQLLPVLTQPKGFYVHSVVSGPLPVPRYLFDFTPWHVLLVSLVVLVAGLLVVPPVRGTLTALTGLSIPGVGSGSRGGGPAPSDLADAAVAELAVLQRMSNGGSNAVDGLLGEFGLEAGSQSARARTALVVQAAGVVAGVVAAAAAFLVTSQLASVVFGLLTTHWELVLDVAMLLGALAAVGTVGAAGLMLVGDVLGGGRRSTTGRGSRSMGGSVGTTGVSGPARSQASGFDVGTFERRVRSNPHRATNQAADALAALKRHGDPTPRSKRLAKALLELDDTVADRRFSLSGERQFVEKHAGRSGTSMMDGLADRPPSNRTRGQGSSGGGTGSQLSPDEATSGREHPSGGGARTGEGTRTNTGDDARGGTDTETATGGGVPNSDPDRGTIADEDDEDTLFDREELASDEDDEDTLFDREELASDEDDEDGGVDRIGDGGEVTGFRSPETATGGDRTVDGSPDVVRRDQPDTPSGSTGRHEGRAGTDDPPLTDEERDGNRSTDPDASPTARERSETGAGVDPSPNLDSEPKSSINSTSEPNASTGEDAAGDTGSAPVSGRSTAARFPQFRYDAANTGTVAAVERTVRSPKQAWRPAVLDEECTTTPVVWGEHLLVATRPGHLYAVSLSSGAHERIATPDSGIAASPAVVGDHLAVVTTAGEVVAYRLEEADERLRAAESWRTSRPVTGPKLSTSASPTVADGRLFVAGRDGQVHAFDGRDGSAVWDAPYDAGAGVVLSSPAVADGVVYVATLDGTLHATDAATGGGLWSLALGDDPILATPAVAGDWLLVGDGGGTLYTVDTGRAVTVRQEDVGAQVVSSVAVDDGTAYVASNVDGRVLGTENSDDGESARAVVRAIDLGSRAGYLWEHDLDTMTISSPTVAGDGLFLGTEGGQLVGIDTRSGSLLWDEPADTGVTVQSSVAAVDGGLYVPDHDGTVWGVVDDHD